MKGQKIKSAVFVAIQFACLGYIFISEQIFPGTWYLLLIEIFGIALGIFSIISMDTSTLNVFPDVREGGNLTSRGPYKLIRHPMYLSLVLTCSPLVIEYFSWLRLSVLILLVVNLLVKLHFEERLLGQKYPAYNMYKKKTKKIIPFIY